MRLLTVEILLLDGCEGEEVNHDALIDHIAKALIPTEHCLVTWKLNDAKIIVAEEELR